MTTADALEQAERHLKQARAASLAHDQRAMVQHLVAARRASRWVIEHGPNPDDAHRARQVAMAELIAA